LWEVKEEARVRVPTKETANWRKNEYQKILTRKVDYIASIERLDEANQT